MNSNVDFSSSPAYTQIMVRHRIITLLIIILASLSLYADKAYLYTSTEPNAITASGTLFSDNTYSAASNDFKMNSIVEITDIATGASVVVMVNDVLPKTVEGRTIAITKAAARELGILEKGIVLSKSLRQLQILSASTSSGMIISEDIFLPFESIKLKISSLKLQEKGSKQTLISTSEFLFSKSSANALRSKILSFAKKRT